MTCSRLHSDLLRTWKYTGVSRGPAGPATPPQGPKWVQRPQRELWAMPVSPHLPTPDQRDRGLTQVSSEIRFP